VVEANKANPSVATIGAQFLTSDNPDPSNPRRFRVFATIYNQKLDRPEFGVALDGASASLTLPPGLRFATDPATNQVDVASKPMVARAGSIPGRIDSDDEGIASWWVEATGERYGALTYQVSVSVTEPSPLSRSVSRVINLPTPPVYSYQTGVFQMTGFPFEFDPVLSDNGLPVTILNTNVAGSEANLVLWEYIGNTNPNRFPPYRPATQIVPGRGYFYRPSIGINNQRVVYLKGARPTASQAPVGNTAALPRRIQLEPGWNLIANPYVYDIPLSFLRFLRNQDNPSLAKVTYQTAVASGLVRGGIYFFSPADRAYQFLESVDNPLRPWQAYWIYANERVLLEYANPTMRGTLIQPTPITETNPDAEPATRKAVNRDNDWRQQLVLRRSDGAQDRATFIGIAGGVTSLKDSRNLPKPPPLEDYVYAGLAQESSETRYATMVQAPGGKRVWELELSSDKDDSATLLWPEIAKLPRRVQLSITDLQSGRTAHLRSASSLPVTLRKGVVSRYRITAQMAATQPLRITQLTTRATRSGSSIAVRLSKDATLTARVLTQGGRVVQVLAGSRATTGGQEVLLSWNGRDGSGTSLPAGGYVVEIVATDSEGEQPARRTMLLSKLR
jgi:hypothetical protein